MSCPTYNPFELAAMSAPDDPWGYRARAEREGRPYHPCPPERNDCAACPAHPETLVWNEADRIFVCADCDLGINEAVRMQLEAERFELDAREPECQCFRTDVDIFDASLCELHNASSEWNARLRAVTLVERYERSTEVA